MTTFIYILAICLFMTLCALLCFVTETEVFGQDLQDVVM